MPSEGFIGLPPNRTGGVPLRTVHSGASDPADRHRYVHAVSDPEGALITPARDDTLAGLSSRFARLLKFEPSAGDEIRRAETATDDYHGAAPDGTATDAAAWDVVRFYKDAAGAIVRVRFRTGVAWDARTAGW